MIFKSGNKERREHKLYLNPVISTTRVRRKYLNLAAVLLEPYFVAVRGPSKLSTHHLACKRT